MSATGNTIGAGGDRLVAPDASDGALEPRARRPPSPCERRLVISRAPTGETLGSSSAPSQSNRNNRHGQVWTELGMHWGHHWGQSAKTREQLGDDTAH